MLDKLRPLGRRWPWFGTVIRLQERVSEINGNYLAAAVTLAAFISIFPLLLVAVALVGFVANGNADFPRQVVERLGLSGEAARNITNAIAAAQRSRRTASLVGLVTLFWSGLGLVAALQYAFNTSWQVKGRGLRDKLVGLAWLGGAAVLFVLSFGVTAALNFLPPFLAPLGALVGLLVDLGLWLWAFKVLPNRQVGWKALLPGALLGAIGLQVLKAVGSIYVPRAVASASALYGSLGVVFATLAWLLFFGRLVVYASVLNVVRWEEEHGTVTVEIELPNLPGEDPVAATRAGEAEPRTDVNATG